MLSHKSNIHSLNQTNGFYVQPRQMILANFLLLIILKYK